jgi:hypothetical protein
MRPYLNRGPVSLQVWHVKEPSLLKAISANHRSKYAAVPPVMVTAAGKLKIAQAAIYKQNQHFTIEHSLGQLLYTVKQSYNTCRARKPVVIRPHALDFIFFLIFVISWGITYIEFIVRVFY